jgi:hypothetical protein
LCSNKEARQTRELCVRKKRGRFARRAQVLRPPKSGGLRMTKNTRVLREAESASLRMTTLGFMGASNAARNYHDAMR